MRTRLLAAIAAITLASSAAWAGRILRVEVHVDTVARTAYGSLRAVADSADNVQYIGCDLYSRGGDLRVICFANDAANNYLRCDSAEANMLTVAQSLSDSSYLSFACDANALSKLEVINSSAYMQK